MEIISECGDRNPTEREAEIVLDSSNFYERLAAVVRNGDGGSPAGVSRRKSKRSHSTPGNTQHQYSGNHHGNHREGDHYGHHDDEGDNHDDDVPLLSDDHDDVDLIGRRLSLPAKLPRLDVTADSLGIRTYKSRFYIMLVFFLVNFVNGMICYMFISTAKTVEFVYDMNVSEILLLQNLPAIGFLIGVWPICWLLEKSGLRLSVIACALLQFLGALLKLPIRFYPQSSRWCLIIGTLLASLGGPLSLVAPTTLSSVWFPANERTMSTAIGAYSLGLGIGFIVAVEPFFLTINLQNSSNVSYSSLPDITSYTEPSLPDITNHTEPSLPDITNHTEHRKEVLFDDMMLIFYMQIGVTAFCLFLSVVYFPNKPPTPPTLSAGTDRVDIIAGLKKVLKSKSYHALVIVNIQYSIGVGYQSALDILLQPLGFSEAEVGIMGGVMLLLSTVSAMLGGWLGMCFNKRLKLIMLVMFFIAGFPNIWFALIALGYLPAHKFLVYAAVVLQGVGLNAPAAILFEAVVEQTYPVGESVSIGFLCFIGNVVRGVLFALPLVPGLGYRWLSWMMVGIAFLPVPMVLFYKERYHRLDLDMTVNDQTTTDTVPEAL